MENYLNEFFGIKLNLGNEKTAKFINDLMEQMISNKFNFKYNEETLNITGITKVNDKNIEIVLHKKNIAERNVEVQKRPYKPRDNKYFNKNLVISPMMPPAMMKKYNLHVDEIFETVKELGEHAGLTSSAIYHWIENKWIRLENKEHGNKGKTSPYQENRGYISEEGRKRISCARSKALNERLEGEVIVTDLLPAKLQKQYDIKPEDIFEYWAALAYKIQKGKKIVDMWRNKGWIEIVK